MSKVREYLTESKGLAKYYVNIFDNLISELDNLISSIETESPKYLEEADIKDVKKRLSNMERYVEILIKEMNNITDLIAKGERK